MNDNLDLSLYLAATAITLAGLIYKTVELRRDPRNPALQSICRYLVFLLLSVGVGCPPAMHGVDALTTISGLGDFLARATGVLSAVCAQALVLHLGAANPAEARRRINVRRLLCSLAILTMTITFLISSPQLRPFAPPTPTAVGAIYLGACLAYLAFADLDILRLSLRTARHAARPLLRFAIRTLSAASLANLAYVGHEAGAFFVSTTGKAPKRADALWSDVLMVVIVLALNVGLVLPSAGPAIGSVARWPRRWRLYRQLHPLWHEVYTALPGVVLDPPADPHKDRLVTRGMYRALYRRVIEIHDALIHLAPIAGDVGLIAHHQALAAGLDVRAADAVQDAALIAIGIRELEGAHPALACTPPRPPPPSTTYELAEELEDDAQQLVGVAVALQTSAVVQGIVQRYSYGIVHSPGAADVRTWLNRDA